MWLSSRPRLCCLRAQVCLQLCFLLSPYWSHWSNLAVPANFGSFFWTFLGSWSNAKQQTDNCTAGNEPSQLLTNLSSCYWSPEKIPRLQRDSNSWFLWPDIHLHLICFQRGFIAQSVEHRTDMIAVVMGSNPVEASAFFFWAFCLSCLITARITFTSILYPQFICMIYMVSGGNY